MDGLLYGQIDIQGALQTNGRRLLQLQQNVAFIHRGHESFAGAEVSCYADEQCSNGHERCAQRMLECSFKHRAIDTEDSAHDPRLAVPVFLEQQ